VAAYGHINNPTPIRGWSYSQAVSPAEYGDYARQWLDLGASIVGGCCGTTPEHIAAVRAVVSACGAAT
jgi:S-methylmethionine-dependent homocysteine/selenocysteine methylase